MLGPIVQTHSEQQCLPQSAYKQNDIDAEITLGSVTEQQGREPKQHRRMLVIMEWILPFGFSLEQGKALYFLAC